MIDEETTLQTFWCSIHFSEEEASYLQAAARIRKITQSRLIERLIRVIAVNQMVLNILDDDSISEPLLGEARAYSNRHI